MAQALKKITTSVLKNNLDGVYLTTARASSNFWANVEMGPPDVILGITEAYKRDTDPKKVNLGVGAYRSDEGKPFVLPSVRKAEELLHEQHLNHEYAPIGGSAAYCDSVAKLAFGDNSPIIKNKTNCTVQSISGTGALRLAFEFISKYYKGSKEVLLPTPTWGNHPQLCKWLGFPIKQYRYYNPKNQGLDLEGMLEDICKATEGSIVLLHACAHNPTGVDPSHAQWKEISAVVKEKKLLPLIDMAYQGFATGDVDNDAFAVRQMAQDGHQILLTQSFAKNMGLYGERAGAFTVVCADEEHAQRVLSQVKIMIRVMYSNPPVYGSRIVETILRNPDLKSQWLEDVKGMADRIISMRTKLRDGIEKSGNKRSWKHVTDQIGMFCYTGLSPPQVEKLTKDCHIYLTKDGRISVAGITSKNVQYIADCIHRVTSQ